MFVSLAADKGVNLGAHICQLGRRHPTLPRGMAAPPVEALYLISKDDALRRTGNNDLKGVIFDLCWRGNSGTRYLLPTS